MGHPPGPPPRRRPPRGGAGGAARRRSRTRARGPRPHALGLPVVGVGVCRARVHRRHVARLHRCRSRRGDRRIPRATAPLRRLARGGRRVSAPSERTRLALAVLGTAVALGIAGDILLRATPWGLNALLCTVGLVAAAAWTARRRGTPVSRDAPWLAATALLLGSNFAARDSTFLRAFDAIGLAIVFSLAALSLQGVALRGRQAWEYVRAALAAAVSACVGVFLLVGREVAWTELPRRGGGRLPQARAAAVGALLALRPLLVLAGPFASADAVFRNLAVNLLAAALAVARSHTFYTAFCAAPAAGYLWGA